MGVELVMGCRDENFTAKMEESAVQEAASGLESIEKLIKLLSQPPQNQERSSSSSSTLSMAAQMDYHSVADLAVSKFRKVISLIGRTRTGHARFRRAPVQNREPPNFENRVFYPTPIQKIPHQQHDSSVKKCVIERKDSATTINFSSSDSAFQISNFSQVSSAGKPPLSSCSLKRKCSSENLGSGKCGGSSGRCHCCSKKRKQRLKRVVRVPAISLKMSDIPPDDYSWRKYGQKPIKGSPHPRGYYKCSSVRGCPARKHVERAVDDPSMLIVTYEADHNHSISVASESDATNLILESS